MNGKNQYGQYMTPEIIAKFMISLANIKTNSEILEPSSGEGVFIKEFLKQGFKNITAYEIDKNLLNSDLFVINDSFISSDIHKKFDLVIGNPPYIRRKNLEPELIKELESNPLWLKYCNALCDYSSIFIIKSIEQLKEGGQLIFITPEYWLSTTHSLMLRNYMVKKGYFEEIYHFNETPIFDKVTVSTIIFKFVKSEEKSLKDIRVVKYFKNKKLDEKILMGMKRDVKQTHTTHIYIPQFKENKNWILAPKEITDELKIFEDRCKIKNSNKLHTFKEFCDIGNGLVSGLDKAFQINGMELNDFEKTKTIDVIKAKNLEPFIYGEITKYIFVQDLDSEETLKGKTPNFYSQLKEYKDKLNKRYQYGGEIQYWKWVFLRNFKLFNKPVEKIFVPCKERISNKDYFRFVLVPKGIYPTQDVTAIFRKEKTKESIYYLLAILNSKFVFDWLRYNGIVKGSIVEFSEKPIASIPYRKIDFNNPSERKIHDEISNLTKKYIEKNDNKLLHRINKEIHSLFL